MEIGDFSYAVTDGELRGALSGAINASFPYMITIAAGKINDIIYIEKVVD